MSDNIMDQEYADSIKEVWMLVAAAEQLLSPVTAMLQEFPVWSIANITNQLQEIVDQSTPGSPFHSDLVTVVECLENIGEPGNEERMVSLPRISLEFLSMWNTSLEPRVIDAPVQDNEDV